jgi:2-oxoglutarate ferredoxin oxidoreductase subunit alpha
MEDEIAGICAAIGASMSGVRSLTATSGPGISLKAENLGLAQMAEVPLVVVNVMRGGPSTGLPTRVSQGDISQAKKPISRRLQIDNTLCWNSGGVLHRNS